MQNTIGETAGQVYRVLESGGQMTLAKLKTVTQANVFTLNAAIGWLAREDKISINFKGRSPIFALK